MRAAYSKIWYNLSVDSERGMTLLEVLLVSAVFSVIFAAVLNFYSGGLRSWSKGLTALDLQQNARIALYEITQELRYAAGIEGFEDEDIIPVCRNDEQPGQGSSRLIYTSVEGRNVRSTLIKLNESLLLKRQMAPNRNRLSSFPVDFSLSS